MERTLSNIERMIDQLALKYSEGETIDAKEVRELEAFYVLKDASIQPLASARLMISYQKH